MINLVNGYVCHNCTDVDYAKKGIDPAHPNKNDPLNPKTKAQNAIANAHKTQITPAVILGGALAKLASANSPDSVSSSTATNQNPPPASDAPTTGTQLNISV
jgi:hypothetical protein